MGRTCGRRRPACDRRRSRIASNRFAPTIGALIALSLVYVAIENGVGRGFPWGLTPAVRTGVTPQEYPYRWVVGFAFGLFHGLGFAIALQESLQFAGAHHVAALVSYNVGLELGTLIILAIVVPALNLLFTHVVAERAGIIVLSVVIGHVGWHWMTERGSRLSGYEWPALDAAFFAAAIRWAMLVVGVAAIVWLIRGAIEKRSARGRSEQVAEKRS